MDKLHKMTSKEKEEKELALSLFRIPINFFAEDNKDNENNKSSNIKTTSNDSEKLKVDSTSSISNPDTKIKVSAGETAHATISKEIDIPSVETNQEVKTTEEETTKKKSKEEKRSGETSEGTTKTTQDDTTSEPQGQKEEKKEDENKEESNSSEPKADQNPTPSSDTSKPEEHPTSSQEATPNSQPLEKNTPSTPPSTDNDNRENTKKEPGENIPEDNDTRPNKNDNELKDKPKQDKDKNPDNDDKKKLGDKFKDKFGNTKPGKKLKGIAKDKLKNSELGQKAKDKLKNSKAGQKVNDMIDKVANNPAVSTALDGVNKAQKLQKNIKDAKDAVENLDKDKMEKVAGEAIQKAIEVAVEHATNTVAPGAGGAVRKLLEFLGNTKIGKTVKKTNGKCCVTCAGMGCLTLVSVILIILLPIMWIVNLFGGSSGRSAVVGEITEAEFEKLQEASTAYSMISYEDDTTKRSKHTFWKDLFGTNSKYPIEESLDNYLENYYYYTKDLAEKHNTKYKTIIEKHLITKINEGDLTSFGMSFELLISHYNLSTLKAPSSSPQRTKEVDGKTVTYYLDTNGAHMQLFEDVLKSTDPDTMNNSGNLLVSRFNGQVSKKWFVDDGSDISSSSDFSKWLDSEDKKEEVPDKVKSLTDVSKDVPVSLSTILNTKIKDVYIKEYNETRDLSLRDLLEITSTNSYDTQYYTSLVRNILNDTSHIGNIKMNKLFTVLTKRLASVELMTYMLYYQKYQKTMESFLTSIKKYDNSNRFTESFFDQFLTFTHVQHFIALSGSIDDPALAYEIAVASFEAASEGIETEILPNNYIGIKKYTNWFATYHFANSVYATDDGTYQFYMNISDVIPTYTQQQLFDKYNVNRGIYDKINAPSGDMDESEKKIREEENAELNQKAFFEIFETATGIDTAFDSNGNFSLRTPEIISYNCVKNRCFPVDPNASIYISIGYMQRYSQEVIDRLGLTHEYHYGIDYAIVEGTQLFAVDDGIAYTFVNNTKSGYGNLVAIKHPNGYVSIYAHGQKDSFNVTSGQEVKAGDPIMLSGNTGSSSGAHLHFGMYYWPEYNGEGHFPNTNTYLINPNDYLYGNL